MLLFPELQVKVRPETTSFISDNTHALTNKYNQRYKVHYYKTLDSE
jgi:hypothetical protein